MKLICKSFSHFQEKEKFDREVTRLQRDLAELNAMSYDDAQKVQKLLLELDAKESENEYLQHKLSSLQQGAETASVSSNNDLDMDESLHGKLAASCGR